MKGKVKAPNGTILHFDIDQGSLEWDDIRLGKITGSGVVSLMSDPKTKTDKEAGVLSDTARKYVIQKVSENYLGVSPDKIDLKQFEWGHRYEPEAREYYQVHYGVIALECGFAEKNEWIGVSPDSLIGEDGGVEIKCPYNNAVHMRYLEIENQEDLRKMEKGYYCQIMMNMWVTGRLWWDFVSYDPRMTGDFRLHCVRVEKDESLIKELSYRCERAVKIIQKKLLSYA